MTESRRALGTRGEEAIAFYLEGMGYRIAARQYRTANGEIDLVAEDGDEVVFVEVKTRRGTTFGFPEESVTDSKRQKIAATGQRFLEERGWTNRPFRIDVVSLLLGSSTGDAIQHFRGIDAPKGNW
ncbi:MAG TPA: YraN family protein [Patescibacteria group bacterium]|nr:YraN family protein [Patescibacteria group bacterium]